MFGFMKTVKNEKGIALVIVLGVIVALTTLSIEFVYNTRVNYNIALNLRDQVQTEYLAKSATNLSMLVLKLQKQLDQRLGYTGDMLLSLPIDTQMWRGLGLDSEDREPPEEGSIEARWEEKESDFYFGADTREARKTGGFQFNGDFTSTITDEGAKINLVSLLDPNLKKVTTDLLLNLFADKDYDYMFEEESREQIISNIIDWMDDNSTEELTQTGFEDTKYSRLDDSYNVKNARFDSIEELGLVYGIGDDFMNTFAKNLTIYSSGTTGTSSTSTSSTTTQTSGSEQTSTTQTSTTTSSSPASGAININTASNEILDAILLTYSRSYASIVDKEEILEEIDDNRPFSNPNDFINLIRNPDGLGFSDFNPPTSAFSVTTSIYKIEAKGMIGAGDNSSSYPREISKTITAVINANDLPKVNYLYWRIK